MGRAGGSTLPGINPCLCEQGLDLRICAPIRVDTLKRIFLKTYMYVCTKPKRLSCISLRLRSFFLFFWKEGKLSTSSRIMWPGLVMFKILVVLTSVWFCLWDSFKVSLPLFFLTNGVVDHHCVCNLLPCVVFASVRCESSFPQQINVWWPTRDYRRHQTHPESGCPRDRFGLRGARHAGQSGFLRSSPVHVKGQFTCLF